MKSWWHATRAVVYNWRNETDIGILPLPVTKLPNISYILGLWTTKRVIHYIHLTGQKRHVTEQKWIWPVIVTGDYPKIISSPVRPKLNPKPGHHIYLYKKADMDKLEQEIDNIAHEFCAKHNSSDFSVDQNWNHFKITASHGQACPTETS